MKISAIINYSILTTILLTFSSVGMTQIIGAEAYAIGDHVEFGINADGHEGAPNLVGSNARSSLWLGSDVYFGFVSNPQTDGWGNYDGDFFSPGSPENGFGIEVSGTNYSNNASGWPAPEIPGSITSYNEVGDCIEIVWDGAVAGVEVNVLYKLIKTELYYSTTITLTNTTAGDLMDVYYYRNFDPDNNQSIGWGFPTTNTVVSQPDPDCEIALVSAEQFNTWDNYIGLGAIGQDFRVTHGGFSNRNASDIWNAAGFLEGTEGAVSAADQAISLAYHIDNLEAGTSEAFQFVVIMSEDDVDAAIASLYHFDYPGSDGVIDECAPVVDTIQICAGDPTEISVDGPSSTDYTWDWTPTTDIVPTVGPTVTVSPTTTTTYTVTGTPVGGCLSSTISKDIVIEVVPSPEIEVIDPGPQCGDFDLSTLVINDLAGVPGMFTEFYDVAPDSADQVVGILGGTIMSEGDDVWLLMGEPDNLCFDSLKLDIDFGGAAEAGPDDSDEFCNTAGTIITVSDYLSASADPGGNWTETSVTPSGTFDPATTEFDASGLAAGTYEFEYIAVGLDPCEDDTAYITIDISQEVNAGDDNVAERCNAPGEMVDLNTLLSADADAGGTWEETTSTGAFNPATGIVDVAGVTPGDIIITYTMDGTAPCPDDVATFTITVNGAPDIVANPGAPGEDIVVCEGTSVTLAAGGVGPGGSYVWDGGVTDGVSFVPDVGTEFYTVIGTNVNGCENQDDISVTVNPTPAITLDADTTEGCTPFEVVFTGTSDPDAVSCEWTFGNGATSDACGLVSNTYTNEGVYDVSLTVTDVNGCTNSLTYNDYITVATTPIASFTYGPQQLLTDDPVATFDNSSLYSSAYEWDFDDGSPISNEMNPTHEFPPEGYKEYNVTLTASNYLGCTDQTSKIVRIDEWIVFYVPNIFTPDGDEYNETFKPEFYSGVDPYDYHMTIFNRYGEVIWESFDYTAGWDGTYGSRGLIQDGTYVWQIEFKEKSSDKRHKHHGHVTILK